MMDISQKNMTQRRAVAEAILHMAPATMQALQNGTLPKGDPLPVAKVAAIQAAKNTSQIIPYCHPLQLEHVGVEFIMEKNSIRVRVAVAALYKTGVEMEALTAVSVAALTLYDMMKAIDPGMWVSDQRLIEKTGGKSDFIHAA